MNLSEMPAEKLLDEFEEAARDKINYLSSEQAFHALRAELLRRIQGDWNQPEMEPEADGEYLIHAFFSVANHGAERTDVGLGSVLNLRCRKQQALALQTR